MSKRVSGNFFTDVKKLFKWGAPKVGKKGKGFLSWLKNEMMR